ncbi:GPALPP1 [Branchiostoma lanceolatum]|uniref:GPALPP motifs-containing protein 1 n=1 Tax=Branchiostoma lanceolatum TaxID=7740 RepID=A0A8J9Z1G2_BRALA|nr:GPALPP1 [Branchiostoma lanceolatum]
MMAEIGPVLPPGFRKSADDSDGDDDRERTDRRTDVCAPALPPGFQRSPESHQSSAVIGPALPLGLAGHAGDEDDEDDEDDDDNRAGQRSGDRQEFCGPALPPGFKKSSSPGSGPSQSVIGPALPPGFSRSEVSALQVGAALPVGYSDDDDDDDDELIGPMLPPSGEEDAGMSVAQEFDKRAQAMKDKLEGKNQVAEVTEREEWMLELPSAMTSFGMGPRTFRRNAKPDMGDRSVWTDTPADKARKAAKGKDDTQQKPMKPADLAAAERDIRLREQVSTYNEKKRGSSLLDQHQKARKRKAEEEDELKERRPFDRDLDLGAGQLDAAKRRQLIKYSRQLNDRFSSGGQQFL